MIRQDKIKHAYKNLVELNYQLYNSLFLTLPLDAVEQTSLLLPLLVLVPLPQCVWTLTPV